MTPDMTIFESHVGPRILGSLYMLGSPYILDNPYILGSPYMLRSPYILGTPEKLDGLKYWDVLIVILRCCLSSA